MAALLERDAAPIVDAEKLASPFSFESMTPIESQDESDRRYAAALASDLRARGEVYSASLVERMQRQIDAQQPAAPKRSNAIPDSLLTRRAAMRAERQREITASDWWLDSANIADLIRYLVVTGTLAEDDFEEILAIVERPWRWGSEWGERCDVIRDHEENCAL